MKSPISRKSSRAPPSAAEPDTPRRASKQLVVGCLLDGARDALPVLGAKDECMQDRDVQRPVQKFEPFLLFLGRHSTRVSTLSGNLSTQRAKENGAKGLDESLVRA